MKKVTKIMVAILSIIVILAFSYRYLWLITLLLIGNVLNLSMISLNFYYISLIILFTFAVHVLYKYILSMFEALKSKKWKKAILMLIILFCAVFVSLYVKSIEEAIVKSIILKTIYILVVIVLPLIILMFMLLNDKKFGIIKFIKIIFILLIIIGIYILNLDTVNNFAKDILITMQTRKYQEITNTEDILYLDNYTQVMVKKGYLTKFDIQNILSIIDSKSDTIKVIYEYDNSIIETTNDNEEWKKDIEKNLSGNYYKMEYEYENQSRKIRKVIVKIKKYKVVESISQEKNEDIRIIGIVNRNLIENIATICEGKDSENYTFYNKIKSQKEIKNKELQKFKILLVYDESTNNFIPYTNNDSEYDKIKEYKIYSSGIDITLENEIELKNTCYTLRINKYTSNYEIADKMNNNYHYEFEPVVTTLKDWNNNTVLEIKFNQTYIMKDLKNIEILFGYNY